MPELPEVETMRRGVLPVVGYRIAGVGRTPCPRKLILVSPRIDRFRCRAVGQMIVDVRRVGKRVLVLLEDQHAIVFEPRMTGLVLVADPPDAMYLRFRVELAPPKAKGKSKSPREILYWDRRGLGSVRLLSPSEQETLFSGNRIGPDALAISAEELRERLASSRRAIKVALLDQRVLAGVGNLYASELLHRAGVHPAAPCRSLRAVNWADIHAAMVEVLAEAIRYEGSTLSDGTYRNALNQQGGYQNQHRVYDRAGKACGNCREGTIVRIVQAQRATFLCPNCQTKRRKRR